MPLLISTAIVTASKGTAQLLGQVEFPWKPNEDDDDSLEALSDSPELQVDFLSAAQTALIAIQAATVLRHATKLLLVQGGQLKLMLTKAQLQPLLVQLGSDLDHTHDASESLPQAPSRLRAVSQRCQCRIILPRWLEIEQLSPSAGPVSGGTLVEARLSGRSVHSQCSQYW
jgi:hypothetical protein